ncbi:MAG: hypothetical protein ACOY3Z_00605 [Thermodesulfobacteriota bacterium]
MRPVGELWGELGGLREDELFHVITKLFAHYEAELSRDTAHAVALDFFNHLDVAITQTVQCNSNRR